MGETALHYLCHVQGFKNLSQSLSRQHEIRLYLKNGAFIRISREGVRAVISGMR